MKIRTLKRLAVSAVGALAALFTTSSAIAATPVAEWFPGNFPDSPSGSSSNNSSTQNGVTLNKNNNGNVFSTTEGLTIGNTGSNGWPALLTGIGQKNTIVVAYKNVGKSATGTLIAESKSTSASGQISSLNINSGAWYSGYQQTYNRNSLNVTQPDTDVHVFALAYSNTDGTSYYFDGVHKHTESGLKERDSTFAEVCLGAVRGPSRILSLCTMPYIAVYNSKLSDDEAAAAYTRAIAMMNGTEVTRTIAADATVNWSDAAWTIAGTADQEPTFDASTAYKITVTVNGDCTINMPSSIGSFAGCDIKFVLGEGVSSANVTLVYSDTDVTLPTTETAVTTVASPFGTAYVTATGATLSYQLGSGLAEGYAATMSGTTMYVSKRPSKGVYSVRIGWRGYNTGSNCGKGDTAGYIDPSYESVGPYPIAGQFWDHTQVWRNNSPSGTFTDIQTLTDAEDGTSTITMGYYGKNSYFNNSNEFDNDFTTPNGILTSTYIDDSDSGNGALTATDKDDSSHTINLPAPGHTRGWQLHFEGIPFNAYDVYFITASDQPVASLKETPIWVSLDGGTSWKTYVGDSENQKTVLGTDNWKGLPAAQNGVLVEGKNYIKMRITKSLYGDNIGTIDITHGVRNTGSYIRSGLAAIQIVEVENDGVYTLTESGKWSDAVWSVGGTSGQTWSDTVDGAASIAKIVSSETVASVEVDQAVSAGQVVLTGSDPFAVTGSGTLTVDTGFDASAYAGALTLQAPISGTVFIGADTSLQFGGDTDSILPNYTLDGAGAWTKVGTGNLTITNAITLAGVVEAGTVTVSGEGSASLVITNDSNVVLTDASAFAGTITPAEGASGKTTINGTVLASGSIKTEIWVPAEATLKLGNTYGIGSKGAAPSGKMVGVAGTVDLNGYEGVNAYWLHAGAVLQNTGSHIGANQRQTSQIALYGDATVNAASNFGLLASQYAATSIILNDYTLTKTGDASFWLCHTTVSGNEGAGIAVNAGTLYVTPGDGNGVADNPSTVNVPITVGEGATLSINSNSTFAEINGAGTVSTELSDTSSFAPVVSNLNFSAGLTVSCNVLLPDGAVIKLPENVELPFTITSGSVTLAENAIVTIKAADDSTLAGYAIFGNTVVAPLASVGDVFYYTIADALTAAGDSGTVVLLSDCADSFTLPAGVTFNTNGKKYTGTVTGADGYVVTNTDGVYTSALGVAKIGTTGYATLAGALAAAQADETVTLLQDAALDSAVSLTTSITLDLNGKTLGTEGSTSKIFDVIGNATLTVVGTTEGSTCYGRFNVGKATDNNGSLVLNGGTYAVGAGQTVVHVNGTCTASNVTITDATITAADDNGVQFNGKGTFAISGSTITGGTAVYMKGGALTVTDSDLTATRAYTNPSYNGNGSNPTGDGIVLDTTKGYQGNISLALSSDTTVTSTYGNAIAECVVQGDASTTVSIAVNSATLAPAEGKAAVLLSDTFVEKLTAETPTATIDYGVAVVNGAVYTTLANAVAAATAGQTVTLIKDITLDARIAVEKSMTIDFAGFAITRTAAPASDNGSIFRVLGEGVEVTVKDGSIDCSEIDDSSIAGDGVYAIDVKEGASLTLTNMAITVNSECGACVYPWAGSTVAIQSGTYSNTTTTEYRHKSGWTGMAVNQANVETQLLTITGGKFKQVNPALGDDFGKCTTFLAEGYESVQDDDGYWVVQKKSGYDNGEGGKFTIDSTVEATLTAALPEGKTSLADTVDGKSLTYAQAYALGLWDENAETVADLDATITVADGKVTVSLANAPATGYTITTKVYAKASLTVDWPTEPSTTTTFDAGTAGFYKVEVVISNAQ